MPVLNYTTTTSSNHIVHAVIVPFQNFLIVADDSFASNGIKVFEKYSEPVLKYQMSNIDLVSMTDFHVLDAALQSEQQGMFLYNSIIATYICFD
jgi:hypothetical protein